MRYEALYIQKYIFGNIKHMNHFLFNIEDNDHWAK